MAKRKPTLKSEVKKILEETLDNTIMSEMKKLRDKVEVLERRFKELEENKKK